MLLFYFTALKYTIRHTKHPPVFQIDKTNLYFSGLLLQGPLQEGGGDKVHD